MIRKRYIKLKRSQVPQQIRSININARDFRIINNNPYFSLMKESKTSLGAGIGLIAGIIIGNATDNVGLWIALGLCFGAGIGEVLGKKQKKESKED